MTLSLLAVDDSLAALAPLLPELQASECFIGTGSTDVWSLAARCKAQDLCIVGGERAAWVHNLLSVGLLHIAGARIDFVTRLLSREPESYDFETLPFRQPQGEQRLLRDTAHQVGRALKEHLGRALGDDERCGVLALLLRFAADGLALKSHQVTLEDNLRTRTAAGKPVHFLGAEAAFIHLRDLVRAGSVDLRFGDVGSEKVAMRVALTLRAKKRRVGLFHLNCAAPSAAWGSLPGAATASALVGRTVEPLLDCLSRHQAPPNTVKDGTEWLQISGDWQTRYDLALEQPWGAAGSSADALATALALD